MKTDRNTEATDTQHSTHPDVRISVKDFGPIASGTVDLRPLTVFVGAGNTGKSYFATLIYAMMGVLNNFSLIKVMFKHLYRVIRELEDIVTSVAELERWEAVLLDIVDRIDYGERRYMFSDLPQVVRDRLQVVLTDSKVLGKNLNAELCRCFGLQSISQLVRMESAADSAMLALKISEKDRPFWDFRMNISDSGYSVDGKIQDMVFFSDNPAVADDVHHRRLIQLRKLIDETVDQFFEEFLLKAFANHDRIKPYYLPAARTGIVQSHRVLRGLFIEYTARVGLEPLPVVPTFSGVLADFMEEFIILRDGEENDNLIAQIADCFESETLAGHILSDHVSVDGYTDLYYRSGETDKEISLNHASSMITELAPLALFLRWYIRRSDVLIIEEPEAHLHPAAQTAMAKTLGRLVRAGVRVVVTTHSDWLLDEIGNLIREGELEEKIGESIDKQPFPSSLKSNDVGVWLFRKEKSAAGSTVEEIPFDCIEGVGPGEYAGVAEALYNRSAGLQNRLAES